MEGRQVKFGFWAEPTALNFNGGVIEPVHNHAEIMSVLKENHYISKAGLMAPPIEGVPSGDLGSGAMIKKNLFRAAKVYSTEATHIFTAKDFTQNSFEDFKENPAFYLLQILAYTQGIRCIPEDWKFYGDIPIKRQGWVDFASTEDVLNVALATWKKMEVQKRVQISNILQFYNAIVGTSWFWERFSREYSVFDACWRYMHPDPKDDKKFARTHSERIIKLLAELNIKMEDGFDVRMSNTRNALVHELSWGGEVFLSSGKTDGFNLANEMRRMNHRIIGQLIGCRGPYFKSSFKSIARSHATKVGIRKDHCELLFFDQSVLGKLVDGLPASEEFTRNFQENLEGLGLIDQKEVSVETSAFSILELLGVGRSLTIAYDRHKRIVDKLIMANKHDINAVKQCVREYFKKELLKMNQISKSYLLEKLDEKKTKYSSVLGQKILEYIEMNFFNRSGVEDYIAEALAVDRMYGYPYPEDLTHKVVCSFFVDIIHHRAMKLDFNQCRGMVRALKSMTSVATLTDLSQAAAMQPHELVQWLESTVETIEFGANRDLVDMEVSHYSALGKFNSSGVLMPTLCFTTDNKHQTRTRASVISASVQFILGSFRKMQSENLLLESFQLIEPTQGAIAYVSPNGDVTNIERVVDIPDPLKI